MLPSVVARGCTHLCSSKACRRKLIIVASHGSIKSLFSHCCFIHWSDLDPKIPSYRFVVWFGSSSTCTPFLTNFSRFTMLRDVWDLALQWIYFRSAVGPIHFDSSFFFVWALDLWDLVYPYAVLRIVRYLDWISLLIGFEWHILVTRMWFNNWSISNWTLHKLKFSRNIYGIKESHITEALHTSLFFWPANSRRGSYWYFINQHKNLHDKVWAPFNKKKYNLDCVYKIKNTTYQVLRNPEP
jgi:hypothetical protein